MMKLCVTVALLAFTGCSGLPSFMSPDQSGSQRLPGVTSYQVTFSPKEPTLGELLTSHYSDFPDGDYELWLEKRPNDNTDPRTKVGSLAIQNGNGVATVELKPEIGVDEVGKPFTLSTGEQTLVALVQPGGLSFFTPPITIR